MYLFVVFKDLEVLVLDALQVGLETLTEQFLSNDIGRVVRDCYAKRIGMNEHAYHGVFGVFVLGCST